MPSKFCSKCGRRKDLDDYYKTVKSSDGHQAVCKDCRWEYSQTPEHQHKRKNSRHLRDYGITRDQRDEWLDVLDYACEICGVDMDTVGKGPHMDHCSIKKQARGMLCSECNLGLGKFKHDPELLRRAIDYLQYEHNYPHDEEDVPFGIAFPA